MHCGTVPKCQFPRSGFFGIVVGNAPIQWSGAKFATSICFRPRFGAILKCWLPERGFFVHMKLLN